MLRNLFILIVLLKITDLLCYSQDNYRVKPVSFNDSNELFVLPPCSKIANEGLFGQKKKLSFKDHSKFRYHYIAINGINSSYIKTLNQIQNSIYLYSKKQKLNYFKKKRQFAIKEENSFSTTDTSLTVYYSDTLDCVVIEIDMQVLLNGEINKNYLHMARETLSLLCQKEASSGTTTTTWPNGISQEIIEHIFDLIPVPVQSTMARYMHSLASDTSLILLSPKFVLKVEETNRVAIIDTSSNFQKIRFDWEYNRFISYEKDDHGNIVQNRFTGVKGNNPDKRPPNNLFIGTNLYKIASFADIENSSDLRNKPYIALYSQVLKRNNIPKSSRGFYPPSVDGNLIRGNGFLLHFSNEKMQDLNYDLDFSQEGNYIRSVFGERNMIQPWIPLFNNYQHELLPLITKKSDLTHLPGKSKIYRKFRSNYRRVITDGADFYLLPNDHIFYKL